MVVYGEAWICMATCPPSKLQARTTLRVTIRYGKEGHIRERHTPLFLALFSREGFALLDQLEVLREALRGRNLQRAVDGGEQVRRAEGFG